MAHPARPEIARLILCSIGLHIVCCCVFPEQFQGKTWYTNIRPSMRRQTSVYFRGNIMEMQDEQTSTDTQLKISERRCVSMFDIGKYIIAYTFPETMSFGCLIFVNRSMSIIQLKFSRRSKERSAGICDDSNFATDENLLVSYTDMQREFTPCPFSGGYNMKIRYKNGRDNGCNFMGLPMRLESECHTGDGITMNFRSPNCVKGMPMEVVQSAICIAHWRHDGDVISILRKSDSNDLWCLRIPARASFSGNIEMLLFTDFACSVVDPSVMYYTLDLQMELQLTLCADEHLYCEKIPCNGYLDSQCYKSCGKCDPNVYPTTCDFPRRLRGDWFVNDISGIRQINISESHVHIDNLGDFDCVTFPDSPRRKTRQFTTVSFFANGCRPRYTCMGFKRISPNSFGYAISQSRVWPILTESGGVGTTVCASGNFQGDPSPINDTYRTYNDVYKPMVTSSRAIVPESCSLTSSYVFNATFRSGRVCKGLLYQLCEDSSRIHIEFTDWCPDTDSVLEFSCIGDAEGKYWQKLKLLQNTRDRFDTRCIVFSNTKKDRVLVLPSGECDKLSWFYVSAGLRTPLLDLAVTPGDSRCKSVTTTPAIVHAPEPVNDAWRITAPGEKTTSDRNKYVNQNTHDTDGRRKSGGRNPTYRYNSSHTNRNNNNNDIKQSRDSDKGHNSAASVAVLNAFHCASLLGVNLLTTLHC